MLCLLLQMFVLFCLQTDLSCFSEFVTPDVVHDKLPRFFWRHLEKDLTLLASSLNRNFDDAVLIIHLLLRKMSQMPAKEFPGTSVLFV